MLTQSLAALLLSTLSCLPAAAAPSQVQPLPAATELRLSGAFQTELRIGARPRLTILGPAKEVEVRVQAGRLEIGRRAHSEGPIRLVVELPSLEAVHLIGAQDLQVCGLAAPNFVLRASGASRVILEGAVDQLDVRLSGNSTLEARRLSAQRAVVSARDTALATVRSQGSLEVEASGSAHVEYFGHPEIDPTLRGAATMGTTEI